MRNETLRIGILGYGLDRPLTGIGRYTIELACELANHNDQVDITLIKPFSSTRLQSELGLKSTRIYGRLLPSMMMAGPPQIAWTARSQHLDLVHDPFGISPFLFPRTITGFGRVVTIHDIVPFLYPEVHARLTNVLFRRYIPRTLRFVDRIITVSETSKRDIIRFYGFPGERIDVVYNGVSERFTPVLRERIDEVCDRHQILRPYILAVGSLNPRKNLETLIDAYHILKLRGLEHTLVVVGPVAWKSEGIFARLRDHGIEKDVILTGYLPDDELPAIYAGGDAFAFPSLYEGFGLPPLEAMACGTPVITSNTSSFPEVIGDAGIMVDPHDVNALADALARLVTDHGLRAKIRARGLERAKQFTWERSAREHVSTYRSVSDQYPA